MPELTSKENVSLLDVREIHTIKVVEHIKDVVVPNFIEKDVEVPKYREVNIDRPIIKDKEVVVEKIKIEDVTNAIINEILSRVKELIEKTQIEVVGNGVVNFKVK